MGRGMIEAHFASSLHLCLFDGGDLVMGSVARPEDERVSTKEVIVTNALFATRYHQPP